MKPVTLTLEFIKKLDEWTFFAFYRAGQDHHIMVPAGDFFKLSQIPHEIFIVHGEALPLSEDVFKEIVKNREDKNDIKDNTLQG